MRILILFVSLIAINTAVLAEVINGRVVGVADGDTITVLADNREHKVRLAGIDAPEKRQPYGMASKQHLSDLIYGKSVTLECSKTDRYKRHICTVMHEGQDVCLSQLASGMAWWYRKYAGEQTKQDRTTYAAAEEEAKSARRGLWAEQNPVPPWDWRHR